MTSPSTILAVMAGPILTVVLGVAPAWAQVFGTFSWQMQPYCNRVTLTLTATPAGWVLDGVDDQCGAANKGSAVGVASFNATGNVTLNFTIVTAPGAAPVHVSAVASPTTGNGTWSDSNGYAGTFAFFGSAPGLPVRPDGSVLFRATLHGTAFLPDSVVAWTGITHNTGGGTYSSATGRYTVPVAGTYLVSYSVIWAPGSATSNRVCAFIRTPVWPVEMANCTPVVGGAQNIALTGTSAVPLNAGDTIEIRSNGPTGAGLESLSGSGLTIVRLR